jgi:hypothetical protein
MSFHLCAEIAVGALVAPEERAEARHQSTHRFHNDTTRAERSEYGDRIHMACPYGGGWREVSRGFGIGISRVRAGRKIKINVNSFDHGLPGLP